MHTNNHLQRGFSLIEILAVLVILGIVAGIVATNVFQRTEGAKSKAASTQIQRVAMAVEEYYLDNGEPPEQLEDLINEPPDATSWNGPYLKTKQINDPWGKSLVYRYPGEHGSFDITSYGADGAPGGEGKNADINSWE